MGRQKQQGEVAAKERSLVSAEIKGISDYRVYAMNDVPSSGAEDGGGPAWEQALVRRIREKNLAWKSEKTYRGWCRRFMATCAGKPEQQLDHGDIRKWLSGLAVKDRVSVATQAQA